MNEPQYQHLPIQPVDYITSNGLNFAEGNIIKYVSRHRTKGGKDDLMKAMDYLKVLIKSEYDTTTD